MAYLATFLVGSVLSIVGFTHGIIQPHPGLIMLVSAESRIVFAASSFVLGVSLQAVAFILLQRNYKELLGSMQRTKALY